MEVVSDTTPSIHQFLKRFLDEIKNFKTFFNLNDFAEGVFWQMLSANDILSDFILAEKLFKSEDEIVSRWFTFFAYYFIACPGFMFLIREDIHRPISIKTRYVLL